MELYKTVRSEAAATQVIEKSKFIAHVKPVSSREEGDAFVAEIKARYKDATHNVPAMVIGDKSQIQWASDDGEPQGTSGAPMVQMMVKEGLTNLVVVVTRYFGGIKLGTGGLVRAYTGSAKLGIEAAGICSVREIVRLRWQLEYSYLAKLQNMAAAKLDKGDGDEGACGGRFVIEDIEYGEKVVVQICTLPEGVERVKSIVANLTAGTARMMEETADLAKV
ncbi:MAG: YigZ family protein [Bacillota bacterium]|nr:YigZ family protein [Bacillota bacterium]